MNSRPAYNSLFMEASLQLLLLPLYGVMLFCLKFLPLIIATIIVLVVCLVMFAPSRWRGKWVLVAALIILSLVAGHYSFRSGQMRRVQMNFLQFGTGGVPVTGISVSCNGVKLGETPFRISEQQLNLKVKPWPTPPVQPRIERDQYDNDNRYRSTKFYNAPYNPFYQSRENFDRMVAWSRDEKSAREIIAAARYWWHFEKSGCIGLSFPNFGGGSSGNPGRMIYNLQPQIEFPSVQPHLDRLSALLNANAGQPSPQWLAHWRKYQELLFLPAWQRAQKDAPLMAAILASVRQEYGIPAQPSAADAERVLRTVIDHAKQSMQFMVPSPDSLAIDLLGQSAIEPLTRLYLKGHGSLIGSRGNYGESWSGEYSTWRFSSPERASCQPLEYAVARYQPPALLNGLIYAAAQNPYYMRLIAQYRSPDAIKIITVYLHDFAWPSLRSLSSHEKREANQLILFSPNPELESLYRQVLQENASPEGWNAMSQYVDSRIGHAGIDQGELATWIFHFSPLNDRQKMDKLVKINAPQMRDYLWNLAFMNDSVRKEMIYYFSRNPNPDAADFLIQSTYKARIQQDDRDNLSQIICALAISGNPKAHEFIQRFWSEGPQYRSSLLRSLSQAADKGVDVSWAGGFMAQAEAQDIRVDAAPLLIRFGSPEAQAVARQWAAADPAIAEAVRQGEAAMQAAEAKKRETLEQAGALIAGKMKPDDLLEPQPMWVWNGQDYVAEPTKMSN